MKAVSSPSRTTIASCILRPPIVIMLATWYCEYSNAFYLTAPKDCFCIASYHVRTWCPHNCKPHKPLHHQIMALMTSCAKSCNQSHPELGTLFLNTKHACPLCTALEEFGHPQPAMPVQTDNTMATGMSEVTSGIEYHHWHLTVGIRIMSGLVSGH